MGSKDFAIWTPMPNATEFGEDFNNLKFENTASKSIITLVVVMVYKEDEFVN